MLQGIARGTAICTSRLDTPYPHLIVNDGANKDRGFFMSVSRHTTAATKPTSAVSYLRARSNTGASTLSAQREAIQAYAISHGVDIVQEYCDGEEEADDPDPRPAYHRLLHDLEQSPGNFSTILIADWTRWSRSLDLHDVLSGETRLRRAGVTLTAVASSPANESTDVADTLLTTPPALTPVVVYLPATDPIRHEALSDAMLAYACTHALSIQQTYHDDARHPHFPALQQLLADAGQPPRSFSAVLTPHASWWVPTTVLPDEKVLAGACEQLDIVLHLLHPNAQDSPFIGTIVQIIKQYMASEYARELSAKVLDGAKRLGQTGAHLGGKAGYGYRRMLIDRDGHHLGLLEHGIRKTQSTQRVILVPGPDDEITLVNWMYRQIAEEGQSIPQLVTALATRRATTDQGRPWTRTTVRTVVTSSRYIGTLIYNRTNTQLGGRRHLNATSDVITVPNAFPGIVPAALYHIVQDALAARGEIKP